MGNKYLLGIGLTLLLFGLAVTAERIYFITQSGYVMGTVLGSPNQGANDNPTYYGSVSYKVGDDQYRVRSKIGSGSPWVANSHVGVRYKKSQPSVARIDCFSDLWLIPFCLCFPGALFLFLSRGPT